MLCCGGDAQFRDIEQHIASLEVPFCVLRLALFMENNLNHVASINYDGSIYSPQKPSAKFVAIAVNDIAEARPAGAA